MGIGDWGLGIGDWGLAQSPIPNPQHFIFRLLDLNRNYKIKKIILNRKFICNLIDENINKLK